ncbi:DUF4350 domain-containing protein [Marinobacterium lutimaris]|uniref:DUF4350 domain-containing protein n=1 Tax=Marinobacterium lutimaris TaxID=568106 RepID=A0A1H6D8J6_9GAMM|nr:DUF4350 domain-containing protein [Marinobacterium lutimaris]SEG81448.1 hypothetical protein SAMN05444390_105196 [Marinobacterium lutimaris]
MNRMVVRILVILLLALLVLLLFSKLHRVERLVNQGPTAEVLRNAYFAAGRFIEEQGISVEHKVYPVEVDELDATDALLLTDVSYLETRPDKAHRLLDWVSGGGHLIWQYTPALSDGPLEELLGIGSATYDSRYDDDASDYSEDDSEESVEDSDAAEQPPETALEQLNAALEQAAQDPSLLDNAADEHQRTPTEEVRYLLDQREEQADEPNISRLQMPGNESLQSLIYSHYSLLQDPDWATANYRLDLRAESLAGERVDLMNFHLGLGQVSVVSDASIWSNDDIGLFDHAALLRWLVADADRLYIQRYTQWPTLNQLIWQQAREPALIILLMLLLWALARARRFGPLQVTHGGERRALGEHVEAVARFHQQHRQFDHLLGPLRRQVLKRASRYHAGFDQLNDSAQYGLIADRAEVTSDEVSRVMTEAGQYTQQELVETVKLLIKIRNQL